MLLFVSACQPSAGTGFDQIGGEREGERALVTRIYDGDTVAVETDDREIDVRLAGVNAPEQGECFSDEGTDYLIETLNGEEVALEIVGADQFGRTLAHVFTGDGIHVNLQLVEAGLAIASTPSDGEPYGRLLLDAEDAAWDSRVGLWGEDACGVTKTLPQLVIASVAFDPSGSDDQVLADETITIANEGSKAVNLTGWVVRDESSRHRYRFPNGRKLEPGEEMVITSADEGWDPGHNPVWNNSGDQAMLLDKHGRVVSRWRY